MRRSLLAVSVVVLAACVVVSLAGGSQSAPAARWVIRDLGALGGKQSVANDINERGQIVGGGQTTTGASHAFLWEGGKMRDLGTLGGTQSAALAVNSAGQVVGFASTTEGALHAAVWEDGTLTDLGTLPGYQHSVATAINDRGQIVGFSMNRYLQGVPADRRGFLWEKGKMRDLGELPDYSYTSLVAINDSAQVVGTGFDTLDVEPDLLGQQGLMLDGLAVVWADGVLRPLATPGALGRSEAVGIDERGQVIGVRSRVGRRETFGVLWRGGMATDLGALGGRQSRPFDINERGQIVGWAATGKTARGGRSLIWHAFLWQSGRMTDLGSLGGEFSLAVSVNDRAQIVGFGFTAATAADGGPIFHASLWQSGTLTDLGTLGGLRSVAQQVNERGQVIGWSQTRSGNQHAVLWMKRG